MKYLRRAVLIVLIISTFSSKNSFAHAQTTQYREALTISTTGGAYTAAAFSPDGRKIATWVDLIELDIWDSSTGKLLKQLNPRDDPHPIAARFRTVEWSPNGQYVLGVGLGDSAMFEWFVYIWDVNTGQRTIIPDRTSTDDKRMADGFRLSILDATWRPKTLSLLVVDVDGTVRLIDFPSGRTQWSALLYPEPFFCLDVDCNPTWNPSGTQFVIDNDRGFIFDGDTGKPALEIESPVDGRDSHLQWTSDGKYMFDNSIGDGGLNSALYVWNAATGKLLDIPIKEVKRVAFSLHPDAERIAYVANDEGSEIIVAKWRTGETQAKLSVSYPYRVDGVSWSPDGKRLMLIESDSIHIFEETASR